MMMSRRLVILKLRFSDEVQQVTQSAEFQNMNRILKLQDQIRQQSQFVEQIKVNATPDLHHCITTAYFEKSQLLVSIFQENIFPMALD